MVYCQFKSTKLGGAPQREKHSRVVQDQFRCCREGMPLERTRLRGRDILPESFMKSTETRDWGIWYTGACFRVAHFLKTVGPESKVRRFTTRQAAEVVIAGSWTSGRYEARLIPNPKPLPVKN